MTLAPALAILVISAVPQQEMPTFKPLPEHKLLAKDVGTWEGVMKMYGDPNAPAVEMPCKETNTLMPGGLWLISEFHSGPFQGKGQFGYDPIKKKAVGTWIDTTAPYMSIMEGTMDKKTGDMTMFSTGIDPATQKPYKMKSVSKRVGNTKEFTMYMQPEGSKEWSKAFVITYKKTK